MRDFEIVAPNDVGWIVFGVKGELEADFEVTIFLRAADAYELPRSLFVISLAFMHPIDVENTIIAYL